MQMYMCEYHTSQNTQQIFFSGRDPFHGVPFIVSLMVLHFAFNNTKVCTIAKKTRVTTVKDTQTDLNILVMRLAEAINARQLHKAVWCFCGEKKTVAHMHPIIHAIQHGSKREQL